MGDLFGLDKVYESIKLLRESEPPDGYMLAFSGGKDSIVIKDLAIAAGVKFEAHYHATTLDPPELIRYIRRYHKDVVIDIPRKTFYQLVPTHGLPTRIQRWCCRRFKEVYGANKVTVTGIRAQESLNRARRSLVEQSCVDSSKRYLHPILFWTEEDVWSYIKSRSLPYCELYDRGWRRIGCLFCPFKSEAQRRAELDAYPNHRRLLLEAVKKWMENTNVLCGSTPEAVIEWWLSDRRKPANDDLLFREGE